MSMYTSYHSVDPSKHLPSLPEYLYKYVKGEDLLDKILPNKSLRFSQPGVFNDPFEVLPNIRQFIDWQRLTENLSDEQYEEQLDPFVESLKLNPFWSLVEEDKVREFGRRLMPLFKPLAGIIAGTADDIMSDAIRERMPSELQNGVGILCLTEEPHNLLMWAHYANMHHEFVLEFDVHHPYFDIRKNDKDELRNLQKVRYNKARPIIGLLNFTYDDLFYIKSKEWSYENEWRMVIANKDADQIIGEGEDRIMLRKFPPECLRSIIVGYRTEEEFVHKLLRLLESDDQWRHVRVKRAGMHEHEFGVTFHPVAFYVVEELKATLHNMIPEYQGADEDYKQLVKDLAFFGLDRIPHVESLIVTMKDQVVNVLTWLAGMIQEDIGYIIDESTIMWGSDGCRVSQIGFVRTALNLKFGYLWEEYTEYKLPKEKTDNPFEALDFQPYAQGILDLLPEIAEQLLTPEQAHELKASIPDQPQRLLPLYEPRRRLTDREMKRFDLAIPLLLTRGIAEVFGNSQARVDHLLLGIARAPGLAQDVLSSRIEIDELTRVVYVCCERDTTTQVPLQIVELHPNIVSYLIEAVRIADLNNCDRIETPCLLLALMKDVNDASIILAQFGFTRELLSAELGLSIR